MTTIAEADGWPDVTPWDARSRPAMYATYLHLRPVEGTTLHERPGKVTVKGWGGFGQDLTFPFARLRDLGDWLVLYPPGFPGNGQQPLAVPARISTVTYGPPV